VFKIIVKVEKIDLDITKIVRNTTLNRASQNPKSKIQNPNEAQSSKSK